MFPKDKDEKLYSKEQRNYFKSIAEYLCRLTPEEAMTSFAKFAPRQDMTKFLARYELFKKILNVHGSIIECGVLYGQGTFSFGLFSSILEPINYQRKVIGFDTFEGFDSFTDEDMHASSGLKKEGELKGSNIQDLEYLSNLFDANRPLGNMKKIEFVKGNSIETIPKYIKDHPELIVSLLYLDYDIYQPTKHALIRLWDRIPTGGIIAFDEVGSSAWSGETTAMLEFFREKNMKLERFIFEPNISYIVKT
jgi:hypothetical protein